MNAKVLLTSLSVIALFAAAYESGEALFFVAGLAVCVALALSHDTHSRHHHT